MQDKVIKETIEKQRSVTDPNISVCVSASAGSGKTKVLIDRILRLMLNGVSISNILCITFTNMAANEMISRLELKLHDWFHINDTELRVDLLNLTGHDPTEVEIQNARNLYLHFLKMQRKIKIQTLHSFCTHVLELNNHLLFEHNEELAISNANNIMNSATKQKLLKNAFDVCLALSKYEDRKNNDENTNINELKEAVEILSHYYDYKTLLSLIKDAFAKRSNIVKFIYNENDENSIKFSEFENNEKTLIEKYLLSLDEKRYSEIIELGKISDEKNVEILECFFTLTTQERVKKFRDFEQIFLRKDGDKRMNILFSSPFMKKNQEIKIFLLNEQDNIFTFNQKIILNRFNSINWAFRILITHINRLYDELKSKNACIDYDDLILTSINIIKRSGGANSIMYDIDTRTDHLLIDEAQDLSAIQWELISLLLNEFYSGDNAHQGTRRTLFMVGDLKQSIYGFQGATPKIFANASTFYGEKFTNIGANWAHINMNVSFRCDKVILDFVNYLVSEYELGFSKDTANKHIPYHDNNGNVEIWNINMFNEINLETHAKKRNNGETYIQQLYWYENFKNKNIYYSNENYDNEQKDKPIFKNKEEHIAFEIAARLKGRLKKSDCNYGDILVLFRKRSEIQIYLSKHLTINNIPFVDHSNTEQSILLDDLLLVGKFVNNPNDDMNLAILLKSPIFNLNDDEIFTLAYSREFSIWKKILDHSESINTKILLKLEKFIEIYKSSTSVEDFYYKIIFSKDTEVLTAIQLYFDYDEVNSSITNLFTIISEFEKQNLSNNINEFIKWFDNKQFSQTKAKDSSNTLDPNKINIMTIHAAKGLEAPIVILADAFKAKNSKYDRIIWHKNYPYIGVTNYTSNVDKIAEIRQSDKIETEEENMRILYVAATRAKKELYFIEYKEHSNYDSNANGWNNVLLKYFEKYKKF